MLAGRGGFEPDRARSVKKTRRWRVFSGARSALAADRLNFERSSKFGYPPSLEHALDASPRLNHRSGLSADRATVSQMRAERDPDRVNFERSSKFGYPPSPGMPSILILDSTDNAARATAGLRQQPPRPTASALRQNPYLFSNTLVTSTLETCTKCSSFSRRSSLAHHMRIRRMMPPAMKSEAGSKRSS